MSTKVAEIIDLIRLTGLLVAVCLCYIGTFCIVVRAKLLRSRTSAHLSAMSISMGLLFFLVLSLDSSAQHVDYFWLGSFVIICFGYIVFHVDNMGTSARRIRLLWEINASDGKLTIEDILKLYPPQEVLSRRIERLIRAKQVTLYNDKYHLSADSHLLIYKCLRSWAWLVGDLKN